MLEEQYRKRLDRITAQLEAEGTPEQDVLETVNDFKSIYDPDARHDESDFQDWYNQQRLQLTAQGVDLSPNPDDPQQYYNYRAAYRSGQGPDETGHWPSKFKKEGHPALIVNGVDTRTGKQPDWEMFENPTPYFEEFQKIALAPKRSAQVTAAPTETMEVPAQNVRAEQMQLQGPENQPEIMPPAEVKPSSEFGLKEAGAAFKMDLKQQVSANLKGAARSLGGDLAEPNPVMFNRGKELTDKNIKPTTPQDKLAVQHYRLHARGKQMSEAVEPAKQAIMNYADEIEKTIPEKDRQTVQEAQEWLTTKDAALPQNIARTAAAINIVSAANASGNLMAVVGMVPVIGAPAAAAGAASLVNREREAWIDNAKAAGLDDEKLQEVFGNFYAVPSGVVEYGSSAVMTGPLKVLKKSKKLAPFLESATAAAAKKSIMKSIVGHVLGTAGAAATEGAEEFTQQQLQDGVLWWALTEAAKKNPEKAEQYIASRDKINLPQTTTDSWKSFIVGAAASLPVNILSRLVGGVGARMQRGPSTAAPATEPTAPPPQPSMPVPEPVPASLTEQQEKTMPARQRRAGEMVAQADQIMPGQIKTEDDLFKVARGIQLKMGLKSFNDLFAMDAKQLAEKFNLLNAKEQQFIQEMPLDEIEAYKVPETPPPAKVVKKTEGTTQAFIPGEAGSIIPPQTTEKQNVQQEEKGRLQVAKQPTTAEGAQTPAPPIIPLPERRKDIEKRKRIEEMTEEEAKHELQYDALTGLKSRRAWEDTDKQPVQGIVDVDGLKFANDKLGYDAGDELLKAVSSALTESGIDAYRVGGDEIRYQSMDKKELAKKLENAYNILKGKTIEADLPDGSGIVWKGLGFSYGLSEAKSNNPEAIQTAQSEADNSLHIHKSQREQQGLRAKRGEEPPGVLRRPAAGVETQSRITAPAAPVEKQVAPAEEVPPEKREIGVYTPKPQAEKKPRQAEKSVAPAAEKIEKAVIPATEPEGARAFNQVFKEALTQQKNQQKAEAKALGKVSKAIRGRIKIVSSAKEPPAAAKKLLGKTGEWESAVWYNPEGKVVEVHINENLPADLYAEALYHEIPGHVGQRLVFADSPAIQNTMRQMYGAAKTRGDVDLRGIEKAYRADIEKAGERGDDVLFEEWVAHNLHRYLVESDRASLPRRIYNLFRSALVKIGVVKTKIDDVLREMVKKMSRAKDMGVIERELPASFKRPVYSQEQETASVSPGEVNLDIDDETRGQMLRRIVTDRYHRLRTLMESVEKKTGKPLPDELNAYVKNDIINSKIKQKVDDFTESYINPIMDIAAQNNLSIEQVDQYLYAKHAEEANRVVGERRPDMVEEGKPPSGMSDEKANEILVAAEKSGNKPALEIISDLVQQWNKARLDMMVKEELLTKKQRAALEEEYKNYVPLKGIDDEQTREELPRVGKGLTVPRKEYYMRKGRTSEAKNILAHLVQDTVEKAVRGEKNKVLRSLYDFSKTFKNDLIVTEPVALEMAFNKKEGVYNTRRRTKFDIKDMSAYGLPVDFKISGEPHQMLIRDVPLMRAMRNMGADEADTFTKIITKGIMPIQRYMAMVRTQLSVNFIPSNALRDTMTAQLNALGLGLPKEQQKGLALEILKNVPRAMKWAYEGQTGGVTEGAKKYKDFVREGGAIEFFGMKDIEQTQKSLIRQLNTMKPGALAATRRFMRDAFNYVTILNGSVENANRLATYTALVKRGVSKQQAAYIAKNITVNFNRKGEMGTFLNAWALFANASIQGSTRILKTLKDSPTVRAAAAGIVASSFGIAELMRQVMGDDPDDDENYYDKVTDFVKDTHMILPYKLFGGKDNGYIRIPLPYGYNVFWALGQQISKTMHGSAKDIPSNALHWIGTIADAFNPIGGAVNLGDPKSVIRNFTPTLLQPVAELAVNQNFMGAPVYKEASEAFGPQPVAAHQALKSTPQAIKDATAWANDLTGGSMYRKGVANVSPDVVKYLIDFGTGGVGKLGTDVINLPFEWISNKKVPARGIPLLQRFTGDINEYKDVKKLYDNLEEAKRIYKDYETYKTTDMEKAIKIRKEYPGVISLFNKIEREIQTGDFKTRKVKQTTLNAAIVKPLQRMNELKKRLDEGKKKDAAERIEKEIVNHAQRSNAALENLLKPQH